MEFMKIIFIQIAVTTLAVAVVWQSRLARREGHRLERLQQKVQRREQEIQRCRAHISKLKAPDRILRLVHSLGLQLRHPKKEIATQMDEQKPLSAEETEKASHNRRN